LRSATCRRVRSIPPGLALRFARVKRYRDDKPAAEADTIDAVRAIWLGQERKSRSGHGPD
jgi:DNA ligase-1